MENENKKDKHIMVSGDINSILLTKNETNGTYSIVKCRVYPGGGPPPHLQTREYEGIYVLDGELTFNVEGKQVISTYGTMINIPPRVIHSFKNNTKNIARALIILSPDGMENCLKR